MSLHSRKDIYIKCNGMEGLYARLTRGVHAFPIYIGVTCPGLLKKWTFSHLSPEKPHKCVLRPSKKVLIFPRQSIWGVSCLGLLKKCMFSHLCPWKPHKCVLKPSEECSFSKMIDLRGHMPRFTLKMHVFPSISLETPEMCVETFRTVLIFLRWSIWGVTCLGLL